MRADILSSSFQVLTPCDAVVCIKLTVTLMITLLFLSRIFYIENLRFLSLLCNYFLQCEKCAIKILKHNTIL